MTNKKTNPDIIRDEIDQLFISDFKNILKIHFSEVEKKILLRAEHNEDQSVKLKLFEQLEEINSKKQVFEDDFFKFIGLTIQPEENWLRVTHSRKLALQAEDMIIHSMNIYGTEHAKFESRINWLNLQFPDKFPSKLYTLKSILQAFITTSHLFDKKTAEQVIQPVENQILLKLEPLYAELNHKLIEFNVIAEIRQLEKTTPSYTQSLINELNLDQELIANDLDKKNLISTNEIINFIAGSLKSKKVFLKSKSSWSTHEFVESFTRSLLHSINKEESYTYIADNDLNVLESAGSIISSAINKKNINPIVRNKITDMQFCFLMAAFMDSDFINQKDHAARLAILEISNIGLDASLSLELSNRVSIVVDDFMQSLKFDQESFKRLNENLKKINQKPKKIEPTSEKNSATDITKRCSDQISCILKNKTENISISTEAKDLLLNNLANFLTYILIRYGRNSPVWDEANRLLDDVLMLEKNHIHDTTYDEHVVDSILNRFSELKRENQYKIHFEGLIFSNYIKHLNKISYDKKTSFNLAQKTDSVIQTEHSDAIPSNLESGQLSRDTIDAPSASSSLSNPAIVNSDKPIGFNSFLSFKPVSEFSAKHVFNNEWFKVFISTDSPLRTLKPTKVDKISFLVIFSNKNGVPCLNLSTDQFYKDILYRRSFPVFESSDYTQDLSELIIQLKKEGLML